MEYSHITLYTSTGFTPVDRPSSPNVLNMLPTAKKIPITNFQGANYSFSFPFEALRNSLRLSMQDTPRLSYDRESALAVDYIGIKEITKNITYYFFVTNISIVQDDILEYTLKRDVFLTNPDAIKNALIHAWADRVHTHHDTLIASDTDGEQTFIDEPWIPQNRLVEYERQNLFSFTSDTYRMIATTVDLDSLSGEKIDGVVVSNGEIENIFPKIEVAKETNFTGVGTGFNLISPYAIYRSTPAVDEALGKIRGMGLQNAIKAIYNFPKQYSNGSDPFTFHHNVEITVLADMKYNTQYKPKNMKCYRMYNIVELFIPRTGNSIRVDAFEIFKSDDGVTSYPRQSRYSADPRPNGKIFMELITRSTTHYITSAPWTQSTLFSTPEDGAMLRQAKYNIDTATQQRNSGIASERLQQQADYFNLNATQGYVDSALSIGGDIANLALTATMPGTSAVGNMARNRGMASGGFGLIRDISDLGFTIARNNVAMRELETDQRVIDSNNLSFYANQSLDRAQHSLRVPEIMIMGDSDIAPRGIYVRRMGLSSDDILKFDQFLTAYGYAVSRELESVDFESRRYFNYIRVNDIVFDGSIPLYLKSEIEAMFKGGIRLWHVPPQRKYIVQCDNPIVV